MPFAVGENIGAYRIMEQLGQGGMATVYKAYHAALDRFVALKVLHPAFYEDQTFTARFQREARVVAKLEHPSIVPIYDFADHEKRPYLVMKYIEGETLKARLARGALTPREINRVVDAVGSALGYAHKQGILHRDIKPSNVLIATDGQMYLADFGLARIAQAGESTLSSDSIMGTPQYISPEQARGDKNLDQGTDIYSFGVMLYEMVVGQVPFNADTPFSIIHDHIYSPLPIPRTINPNIPESIERVLLKALSKERKDRFSDVPSMMEAFSNAWIPTDNPTSKVEATLPAKPALGEPAPADLSNPGDKTKAADNKKPKKRRFWLILASGILLAACCMFAFLAIRENGNEIPGISATQPTPTIEIVLEPSIPSDPLPELPMEVQEARRRVEKNPGDPLLKLDLALAYWRAGQPLQAFSTLRDAAAQTDPDDPTFFIKAGDRFKKQEAWVISAAMYTQAVKSFQDHNQEIPNEVFESFHEAVYKAAPLVESEAYPLFEEVKHVDEPIVLVAQARNAYFNGRLEEGRIFLDRANQRKPGFIEAALLEAEVANMENRSEDARMILTTILGEGPKAPEWVRIMAEEFLNRIP